VKQAGRAGKEQGGQGGWDLQHRLQAGMAVNVKPGPVDIIDQLSMLLRTTCNHHPYTAPSTL
jgi:hypothetical protein